jgi:muramoyltetrapeptide carboxypeptidase
MLRVPEPLRSGDRVRIVAASGPFDRDLFESGVEAIRAAGLEPVFDEAVFARQRYLAGGDLQRIEQMRFALAEEETRAIWTARGGYGATRLLGALDVDSVAQAGKWLVGFSDTTALHCLWARAQLASVHGPNVTTLASWGCEAVESLFAALLRREPLALTGETVTGGQARGPLLGGNLAVLTALAGTGFLPSFAGAVLLIEEVGERPYRIDRMLTQLAQAGALDRIVGVVVGQLVGCEEAVDPTADYDALDIIAERLAGVPMVAGVPVGHDDSSRAVLLGADVVLDASAGTVTPA